MGTVTTEDAVGAKAPGTKVVGASVSTMGSTVLRWRVLSDLL